MKLFSKIIHGQKGQGILEYTILSGLIGIICLVAVKSIGSSIKTRLKQIESKIVKEIQIR